MLTEKQLAIFNFIEEYQIEFGKSPTFAEIQKHFNFNSLNSVFKHISTLEKKGYIKKNKEARGIELLNSVKEKLFSQKEDQNKIPLVGSIPAGTPSEIEEQIIDRISLVDYLIDNNKNKYILRVSGNSVNKSGIIDSDLVIVDIKKEPRSGDIVVALVDNENTLKRYEKDKFGKYHLYPDSTEDIHQEIIPKEEVIIQGVVVASFRKF